MNNFRSAVIPVGACLLFGALGSLLYILYFKKDEEKDQSKPSTKKSEMVVSEGAVGHIYGRHGATLKSIETNTVTEISFKDTNEEGHRVCIIEGLEENIIMAKQLIKDIINNLPDIKIEEIYVSAKACNFLLGRNNDVFREVSRTTGAKISFSVDQEDDFELVQGEALCRLVLKGTKDQINTAKVLVEDKVEEAAELQKKIESSIANLSIRGRSPKPQSQDSNDLEDYEENNLGQELLSSNNGFQPVYVSAVATANHFWVQVVGPRSVDLDNLITSMTEFYSIPDNYDAYELDEDQLEDNSLVAVRFIDDNKWYRGQVCVPPEKPPSEGMTNIYYLDFGLTESTALQDVRELRTNFLRLNFQAIECLLADVDEDSAKNEEAIDEFEVLCYSGLWKPVQLSVTGYQQYGHKTLPVVKLHDISGPEMVDIGEKLILMNLVAKKCSTPESVT